MACGGRRRVRICWTTSRLSDEYLQSAGSADALTVEVRTIDGDGAAHQFVVGKPGGGAEGAPSEVIRWDDGRHSTTVHPREVFTADEAAKVFYAYFLTDEVPARYTLRELHLDTKRTVPRAPRAGVVPMIGREDQ